MAIEALVEQVPRERPHVDGRAGEAMDQHHPDPVVRAGVLHGEGREPRILVILNHRRAPPAN